MRQNEWRWLCLEFILMIDPSFLGCLVQRFPKVVQNGGVLSFVNRQPLAFLNYSATKKEL